jgi:adenylate cyclase
MDVSENAQLANDALWLQVLTDPKHAPRGIRRAFRSLPSAPRCKMCYAPYAGIGGAVTRLFGFRRSRKNPAICDFCVEKMPPGGAEVDVTVLFADVRGSTALGERLGARAFAALLNRFYKIATGVLIAHDATIDKMIGDEVMALFIPGFSGPNYRERAVEAGVALLRAVGYGTEHEPLVPLGVAVHAGPAYVGNVGGDNLIDFTALGDTVNTAARLQGRAAPGELLISEAVYQSVADRYPDLAAQTVALRGKDEPLVVRVLRPAAQPAAV